MAAKRIAADAMLAAAALLLFLVEAQIPAFIPIPGIKLGLANIVTLLAIYLCGRRDAGAVLFVRITVGAALAGNLSTFLYSASGGALCYLLLCCVAPHCKKNRIWVLGVCGAIAHNIGQIAAACAYMRSFTVLWYLPYLLLAAIVSGSFTGICAQFLIQRFQKKEYEKG